MKATINANAFRAAYVCVSKEETRYYLNGVYVEPHASGVGVTLTSTDGHRLVHVYDESGSCDASGIVKVTPDTLRACKAKRGDDTLRVLSIEGIQATVIVDGLPVAITPACLIDGTFPDYQRVIPDLADRACASFATYNAAYLADFGDIASILTGAKAGNICVQHSDNGGPALIRFAEGVPAFGVLMPVRNPDDAPAKLPSWFNPPRNEFAQAAE